MSAIIRPRSTRLGQPIGPVEIDWSNPLAQNLTAYCLATNSGVVELVRNLSFQRVGGADVKSGLAGVRASTGDVVGDVWMLTGLTGLLPSVSSPVAAICAMELDVVRANTAGQQQRAFRITTSSNAGVLWSEVVNYASGTALMLSAVQLSGGLFRQTALMSGTTPMPVAAGSLYTVGFSRRNNIANTSAWRASVGGKSEPHTPQSGTETTNLVGIPTTFYISASDNGSNNHPLTGGVFVVALFSEFASQEKLNALTANPWQLLRPIQHRIWFDIGGAVSDDRTGQAHISHSHSTSASGKKGATGSVAVSHASATAAAGTKAASATVSISHAHALTASGVKQESAAGEGQAHITHSHSLNIVGTKATTGQAAISHAHSLTVTGYKTEQETDARTGTAHIFHAADLFAAGYKATTGTAHITHMHSLMVVGVGPIVPIADDEIYMTTRLDARNYTDRIQARDYTVRM